MCEKISIRLDLKGEEAERFAFIKAQMGLKNDSEVVRALITKERRRMQGLDKLDDVEQEAQN